MSVRRFGIEIELSRRLTCLNYDSKRPSIAYKDIRNAISNRIDGSISPGWQLKVDTSCGNEIVSPVMLAPEGLKQIVCVCELVHNIATIYNQPAVDAECGLHLHFDAADLTPRALSNLFILLHKAEPIIYAMYPYRSYQYCAPIELNMNIASRFRDWVDVRDTWYRGSNNVKNRDQFYTEEFINGTYSGDYYDGTRYHGFNIHCFWRQGSIEFRYATGTIDPLHIKAYYDMCLSLINTAIRKNITLDSGIKDLKCHSFTAFLTQNFRFRKHIKSLCKECNFSKDTINLIIQLVKSNNPKMLCKNPSGLHISNKNAHRFLYRFPNGLVIDFAGRVQNDGITQYTIVDVKLDLNTRSVSNPEEFLVVSASDKFYIDYQIFYSLGLVS